MASRAAAIWMMALASIGLLWSDAGHAADIFKRAGHAGKPDLLFVKGEIVSGDESKFRKLALNTDHAIVVLDSNGGSVGAAIEIGRAVRLEGYPTAVVDTRCASACALIWLAGQPRMVSKNAEIGFHAVWTEKDGGKKAVTGMGNAIVGAYLNSLGLSDDVIAYVTQADPDHASWLSKADADKMGLKVQVIDTEQEAIAKFKLALRYRWSNPPDYTQAVRLYDDSAQSGFAGSQNNLGDMYENGRGVDRNDKFAIYWYSRAAERGEPTAYLSLSSLLPVGTSDERILIEALKFGFLAATYLPDGRNKATARANIDNIEKRLSKDAIRRASELARTWQPLFQETYLMGDTPQK